MKAKRKLAGALKELEDKKNSRSLTHYRMQQATALEFAEPEVVVAGASASVALGLWRRLPKNHRTGGGSGCHSGWGVTGLPAPVLGGASFGFDTAPSLAVLGSIAPSLTTVAEAFVRGLFFGLAPRRSLWRLWWPQNARRSQRLLLSH